MGYSLGGYQSGGSAITATSVLAALVGQDVVARSYTATQASGSDAFKATVNGARWHFGAGASDWASSDGTTVTFNGPLAGASTFTTPGGFAVAMGNSSCGMFLTPNTTDVYGGAAINMRHAVTLFNALIFGSFTDGSGTTGDQTINKVRGIGAFAAASAAITITNSFVAATSTVAVVLQTNDATAILKNVVPAAGSFTINLTAAATGTTKAAFVVLS